MKIELFEPKNEILKKYIKFIYFLTHCEKEADVSYLVFPNLETGITYEDNNNLLISDIHASYMKPLLFTYQRNINEITIVFQILGINHFLNKPLEFYLKCSTEEFRPFDDYALEMSKSLAIQNPELKLEHIENYWLSKLNNFSHPFLPDVIDDMITKKSESLSLKNIAETHQITIKKLKDHFKRYIGKTPSDFRKSVRFRNAIKENSFNKNDTNLTDISAALHFFDQSHMIKDFKAMTGKSPKDFFKNLCTMHDGNINFIFC